MFSWVPIHQEAIRKILEFRDNEGGLLAVLQDMKNQGLKVVSLKDKDSPNHTVPLAVIEPFTFMASFNRGITEKNRKDNWRQLKKSWNLESEVPGDFAGLPVYNLMSSWRFPFAYKREPDHIGHLWDMAIQAVNGSIDSLDEDLFDRCLRFKQVSIGSLSIGLFWINPSQFLPADRKSVAYGKANGIKTRPTDYQSYKKWLAEMTERFGTDYPKISQQLHRSNTLAHPSNLPTSA